MFVILMLFCVMYMLSWRAKNRGVMAGMLTTGVLMLLAVLLGDKGIGLLAGVMLLLTLVGSRIAKFVRRVRSPPRMPMLESGVQLSMLDGSEEKMVLSDEERMVISSQMLKLEPDGHCRVGHYVPLL